MNELLQQFHEIASNPAARKEHYLAEGKHVVLVTYYTPEEIIHAMGAVPFGVWGGDVPLQGAKQYCPAFLCSIVQSILELGMSGTYDGADAVVFPSLCDSLKVIGENWKYAVPGIRFVPMTYPQNRKPAFGAAFTREGYERVIRDISETTGLRFSKKALEESIAVYNEHNRVMRELSAVLAEHPEITARQRSDIFKSAWFMRKEEHTELVKAFLEELKEIPAGGKKLRVYTTGILCDAPGLLDIIDGNGMQIVGDDVAAESRQYCWDSPEDGDPLDRLAAKFCGMDEDTLLYDPEKTHVEKVVREAKKANADGVLFVMTKFCDPEEFDYPLIRNACREAGLPILQIEVDRQMVDFGQAATAIETFCDVLRD